MNTPSLVSRRKKILGLAIGLPTLLVALPLICAPEQRGGNGGSPARGGGGAPARSAAPSRPAVVDRSSHGSVRHVDTHVVERPAEVHREPEHQVDVHREVAPRRDVVVHRDVEVDVHRSHVWNDFHYGRRMHVLPFGFRTIRIGAIPYFYSDGIYYQSEGGDYQEVYPPIGAAIPEPPEGAFEVNAGGQVYYYAGGAFYLQQPDGTYAIAPTPIGVVVPELPPGAVQVALNGTTAYQFNGIYYEPVFVNGVTQYETVNP